MLWVNLNDIFSLWVGRVGGGTIRHCGVIWNWIKVQELFFVDAYAYSITVFYLHSPDGITSRLRFKYNYYAISILDRWVVALRIINCFFNVCVQSTAKRLSVVKARKTAKVAAKVSYNLHISSFSAVLFASVKLQQHFVFFTEKDW